MNERIAKLYDQAIVIENGGDYVCGELDPVKFAELIVQECLLKIHGARIRNESYNELLERIKQDFGVEE